MSDTTHLGLTYLEAAQAQKHVTVNEALARIDALAQLAVKSRALAAPPASPVEAARYLLGAAPTGDWAGQGGKLAMFLQGQWQFAAPVEGWRLWVDDEDKQLLFDGTNWTEAAAPVTLQNMQMIGVNATADTTNRFATSATASLFNHAGAGHQIKLNKNLAADTASLLFQTGFSGRAEIGTTGDDLLHVKVSANGTAFEDLVIADASAAELRLPKGMTLPPRAAPSSPANGQLWHDSATASLKVQIGAVAHQLAPVSPAIPVAEMQHGMLALERLSPDLLGRKAVVLDFVAGGYAHVSDTSADELRTIENIPDLTFTNATGGKRYTRKRKIETVAANNLRYHHGANGVPQGVLIEAAQAYLNKYTQPTVAQLTAASNIADVAAPSGYSGNWLAYGDNSVNRAGYMTADVVAGQDYWFAYLVRMDDGLAPSGHHSQSTGDVYAYMGGGFAAKNPDTGAAGPLRITGPFAEQVYLVEGYVTPTLTLAGQNWGLQKNQANNARTFIRGPLNFGIGRYAPSMFDNATATPNSRAADVLKVPLSGFTLEGGMTLFGEFTVPAGAGGGAYVVQAYSDNTNRAQIILSTTSLQAVYYNGTSYTLSTASLVPGSTYKFAAAFDPLLGQIRMKVQGLAAPANLMTLPKSVTMTPIHMTVGSHNGTVSSFLNGTVKTTGVVDRAWSTSEIAGFTG